MSKKKQVTEKTENFYERLHAKEWNTFFPEKTVLFLPEKEISTGSERAYAGANWEIIVVPAKYQNEYNEFVELGIKIAKMRGGRVIYI